MQRGTSLVVQWLRFWAPNVGGLGSIPDQETRSHRLQLRPGAAKQTNTYINTKLLEQICVQRSWAMNMFSILEASYQVQRAWCGVREIVGRHEVEE